jgi:hypothetical protein
MEVLLMLVQPQVKASQIGQAALAKPRNQSSSKAKLLNQSHYSHPRKSKLQVNNKSQN